MIGLILIIVISIFIVFYILYKKVIDNLRILFGYKKYEYTINDMKKN